MEDNFKSMGITYKRILMVKGPGVGAKAEMTSGFVSMFRQAQHIAGSTNLGRRRGRSLSLSKGRGRGQRGSAVVPLEFVSTIWYFDKLRTPPAQ